MWMIQPKFSKRGSPLFYPTWHVDPITTVDSQASKEPFISSFQVYGIDLSRHDIETLGKNAMMNDNMVAVFMG